MIDATLFPLVLHQHAPTPAHDQQRCSHTSPPKLAKLWTLELPKGKATTAAATTTAATQVKTFTTVIIMIYHDDDHHQAAIIILLLETLGTSL